MNVYWCALTNMRTCHTKHFIVWIIGQYVLLLRVLVKIKIVVVLTNHYYAIIQQIIVIVTC